MSKRRAKRAIVIRPAVRLNNDINVTPLVDVVLVLLIIFMVVTPMLEKDIAVHVATEQREIPKDDQREQIVVQVKREGELLVNARAVRREQYADHLKQLLASRAADDRVVFFLAEDDAGYAKLVSALDGAKTAGATVLGLTPEFMRPPP
ncbi:MAG TPA: biopolymer transporter ExbD [Polyangiaceae bacterium]|nr:biopolymer transporter ExbD [Polyangiaceae bacterium]